MAAGSCEGEEIITRTWTLIGPIGVATSQRGRGIGQVLLYRTLDAMRAQGLHNAWFMWSDDRTAARLYSEAGFVESRRFAVLTRDLA